MGFALPDDGMHAPNEKFHLPNFFNGIATSIHFLAEVAGQSIDLPTAGRHEFRPSAEAMSSEY
jgi:hypothetical protein